MWACRSSGTIITAMTADASPLSVRGLRVALPDGRILIDGIDLTIGAGEVVVLFERDELDAAGFEVVAAKLDLDRGQLGLVPQRGALFDHLDVRGNLELALRHASNVALPPKSNAADDRGALLRTARPDASQPDANVAPALASTREA